MYYLLLLLLVACRETPSKLGPSLPDEQYRHLLHPCPPKPILAKKIPKAKDPIPACMRQNISINLGENVELKKALIALSKISNIGINLDPNIDLNISMRANNQPLLEVIEDICAMNNLRYQIRGNNLQIQEDHPFVKTYNIQFLNTTRQSQNKLKIAGELSNEKKVDSTSEVDDKSSTNFWAELEDNLQMILGSKENFSMHRQAGIVSVIGTQSQHKAITEYLEMLRKNSITQVLIEAKVLEVSLKDQFKAGINWQKLKGGSLRFNYPLTHHDAPNMNQGELYSFGIQHPSFSILLQALEEFGSVRTISSPRLTVLNNQSALLKVAQNKVYFKLNYDRQYNLNVQRENVSVSSEIQTIPIGLVMYVQPSIDADNEQIILSLRPTISRFCRSVRDPAVDIAYSQNVAAGNIAMTHTPSLIPEVEVQEIDSVLRIPNQQIAVLGGLMEARQVHSKTKIPSIGDIPGIGKLFTGEVETQEIVELVILLKATIIENNSEPALQDRRLGHFVTDPRPF